MASQHSKRQHIQLKDASTEKLYNVSTVVANESGSGLNEMASVGSKRNLFLVI